LNNEKFDIYSKISSFKPNIIFRATIIFLLLSYFLIYLIDVRNLFGIQDFFIENMEAPFFWYHWFSTPVEVPIQWYALGLTFLVFSIIAGIAYNRKDTKIFEFWFILSIGLMLMLVEDAGDVRHTYRSRIEMLFGEESYGFFGTSFELFYFAIIGLIMIVAILKYKDVYWKHNNTKKYLFIGYLFYGLGVSASFIGGAYRTITGFTLYENIGNLLLERLIVVNQNSRLAYEIAKTNTRIDFIFMDKVFEESLELLGAAGLLVAGIYFLASYK